MSFPNLIVPLSTELPISACGTPRPVWSSALHPVTLRPDCTKDSVCSELVARS